MGAMPTLESLGWDDLYQQQFGDLKQDFLTPARVVGEEKKLFRLQNEEGIFWGEISGHFRHVAQDRIALPATGDWVACVPQEGTDRSVIHHLLPRRTCLVRKSVGAGEGDQILAANVDTALITTSANLDLNPRRLERYLALVWASGAMPVILVTKMDLAENAAALELSLSDIAAGVEILMVSALTGVGMEELRDLLEPGKTFVLLGSSGVGKSTLANALLGAEQLKTQEVREGDDRGRHTTTARYLFPLPTGALLIDTPGMRELGLTDHGEGVSQVFEDIEQLAATCRFSDCQHKSEPGCVVKANVDPERLRSYEKLQKEMDFERRKVDKAFASDSKKKWKQISKSVRDMNKK